MNLQPSQRGENYRYRESKDKSPMWKSEVDSVESELSDAKQAVRDLALKIEEANSRSRGTPRKPKWRQQEEPETSLNNEDARYAQVMQELENVKQDLAKLKLNMAQVVKQKRHAERAAKASNSKASTLSASIELMKKEIQELGEEQALVELARIEAVKECESIETRHKEENKLQITLSDINMLENELNTVRKQEGSPLNSIIDELEATKRELASIKGEGFNFMTSMDVIRNELKHVRDETARLHKAEQRRDITVQNLNSKILRAKAKLDSLTSDESRKNTVASNLVFTLQQLTSEIETSKKEKDGIDEEIDKMNVEIDKVESEIEVAEERLEAALEELDTVKSSEAKALGDLKNMINTAIEARGTASINSSKITISNFEYEYLTSNSGGAAELANKKIAAAQAWVEALKAHEKEILMKVEMTQSEISELSEDEYERVDDEPELMAKDVASPRRTVKRAKLHRVRTSMTRYSGKSGSLRKEKVIPKLTRMFSNKNNIGMDE